MGKAIYRPAGKAGEYAEFACGFYVGCSNGCTYCFLRKGWAKDVLGGDKPTLKKHFRDEDHAIAVFKKELFSNLEELQRSGLLFSFTTDPMLEETFDLTMRAVDVCLIHHIPVKILTKNASITEDILLGRYTKHLPYQEFADGIAIGFTLTGHDELEPRASTNAERIEAMRKLHAAGFKTWASIEPVISFPRSLEMIEQTNEFCDLYKIGLKSGEKYHIANLKRFIDAVFDVTAGIPAKIYFKNTLLKKADIDRAILPVSCVGSDYDIFNKRRS